MKIPYDVFRNFSDQYFEDFLEDDNFRHCLWDERGWNDEEYWKLEKGIIELIELNSDGKYQEKINAILEKIVDVYFLMHETHGSIIYFEGLNASNQVHDGYVGIYERIERFKSLTTALLLNDASLMKKSFAYSPNPNNPSKKQELELDKNKFLKHLTLIIDAPYSFESIAYFTSGLSILFQELSPNLKYHKSYYYPASYQIFLLIQSPMKTLSDFAKNTRKKLEQDCKILQRGNRAQKLCLYQIAHIDEVILELYLSNKSNALFLSFSPKACQTLMSEILEISKDRLLEWIKTWIQKEGGIYFTYTNQMDKQTLEVIAHWRR